MRGIVIRQATDAHQKRTMAKKFLRLALALCLATVVANPPLFSLQKSAEAGARERNATQAVSEEEEARALDAALEAGRNDLQQLIKNLEEFLVRFPRSSRREQVLRTIYKQASQSNDTPAAAAAAERLLDFAPDDAELLSSLVDLYDRKSDATSREKALHYATRLVESAEKLAGESNPPGVPEEKWHDALALMRATAYFLHGRVLAKSGEKDKAFADYEKSFSAYPTAQIAERLGDLSAQRGQTDRAIEYYLTAFAFPEKNPDPARRDQLRKKLGSAYISKYQSEKGLGDLILARYDELTVSLKSRLKAQGRPGAEARDPYEYVLRRLDGAEVKMSDFRGKLLVLDFWATWCGPCRMEGKLFERVRDRLRGEPDVAFFAMNVDEDRDGVPEFVKEENWTVPVLYAQGLDQLLGVRALPTVMILDREGRVVFRQVGLDPTSFGGALERKIREALGRPVAAESSPSR